MARRYLPSHDAAGAVDRCRSTLGEQEMKALIIAVAVAIAAPIGLAKAAGPFDGKYIGGSPGSGGRTGCSATIATVTIADGKITGNYTERNYSFPITGTVAADGTVTGKWAAYPITGKLSGGHFASSYTSKECGPRTIALDKAG
jgi:hypothetical protein